MCGIAGIVDHRQPPDLGVLERMAASMAKRGPDDFGHYLRGPVGLAHRRLSVIDLESGAQPILNEDETLAVIANGEVYDHVAWREELIGLGHRFRTASDSEVLLHMYEEHGPDFVRRINGMYAFAICHTESGLVFLARDRMGQKPLFFAYGHERFAFASGPAALCSLPWVDTRPNARAISDYLENQYIPTPASIYEGIQKVPPGSMAFWKDDRVAVESYYAPCITADFPGSRADARELLRGALTQAVERRLVADVPVGLFLSGGMDSSLLSAIAQGAGGGQVKTFSIGFPDPRYDERQFAETVAAKLGTDHHFLEVQPGDYQHLRRIVADFEEPFCDSSMLPTALLSEFTRKHVTVALSGDGADELFGGYYRYRVMKLLARLDFCPQPVRRALRAALSAVLPPMADERSFCGKLHRVLQAFERGGIERYTGMMSRFPLRLKTALYGEAMDEVFGVTTNIRHLHGNRSSRGGQPFIDAIMEFDLRAYLVDDILVKVDRASMAHGLEVRSPFLDRDVVDLAVTLPYGWKQRGRRRKCILQETFAEYLPPEIFNRPKMGFGVPVASWLRAEWRDFASALLLDGWFAKEGYFKRPGLEKLVADHTESRADNSYAIFAIMVLELWREQCWQDAGSKTG